MKFIWAFLECLFGLMGVSFFTIIGIVGKVEISDVGRMFWSMSLTVLFLLSGLGISVLFIVDGINRGNK